MYEELLCAIEKLLDKKLDEKLNGRFDMLENRFDSLESGVNELKVQVDLLENQVRCISLLIENDICPSIMRVAEGHQDLNRKLDLAMQSDSEREKLAIRVNYLDYEVRMMKERKFSEMA